MKIVALPIEAIVSFTGQNKPRPHRFRYREDGGWKTIHIDRILKTEERNIAGSPSFLYCCQSQIDGVMKLYELRYSIKECRWNLYKI